MVISILVIVIANAAAEGTNESIVNETSNLDNLNINNTINDGLNNAANPTQNNTPVENTKNNEISEIHNPVLDSQMSKGETGHSNNEKKSGNSVTASFGVYLNIVGYR